MENFEILDKHKKYLDVYKPGEEYWGLGIENETYIERKEDLIKSPQFLKRHSPERYSVEYWKNYKNTDFIDVIIENLKNSNVDSLKIPLLINAHSLLKTDRYGEHAMTYEKVPKPNKKHTGYTIAKDLVTSKKYGNFFSAGLDRWYCFDGDTLEFMTQNFYKAKVSDVIEELLEHKKKWLEGFNFIMTNSRKEELLKGDYIYPQKNHGLAIYHTNRSNVSVFNNGTYHINITLPTLLDQNCNIADWNLFVERHRKVARMFQWLTPFLVAEYGSGDYFSTIKDSEGKELFPDMFAKGSQRLCVSRYISAATYDTVSMPIGKILTVERNGKVGWLNKVHQNDKNMYNSLTFMGVDINFHKHKNHGLELRIFDWFPEEKLERLLKCLTWMCDESLNKELTEDPREVDLFNNVLYKAIWLGKKYVLEKEEIELFQKVLNCTLYEGKNLQECLINIENAWEDKWNGKGEISLKFL